jgi:hypothetical protein
MDKITIPVMIEMAAIQASEISFLYGFFVFIDY